MPTPASAPWARDTYVLDIVTRDLDEALASAGDAGATLSVPLLALEGLIGMLPYEGEGEFAYRRRQFLEGYASGLWRDRRRRPSFASDADEDEDEDEDASLETIVILGSEFDSV